MATWCGWGLRIFLAVRFFSESSFSRSAVLTSRLSLVYTWRRQPTSTTTIPRSRRRIRPRFPILRPFCLLDLPQAPHLRPDADKLSDDRPSFTAPPQSPSSSFYEHHIISHTPLRLANNILRNGELPEAWEGWRRWVNACRFKLPITSQRRA